METVKESREQLLEKVAKLQLQIDKLESQPHDNCATRISKLEEEVKSLKADKACLEKQLADITTQQHSLQTSHDELQTSHATLSKEVDNLKQKEYILVMAQLVQVFQEDCYKHVFAPNEIPKDIRSNIHSYNLKYLIEDIYHTTFLLEKEKEEARRKWKRLQIELDLDYAADMKTMREIKKLRNDKSGLAHPELTQHVVDEAIKDFLSNTEFSQHRLYKLKEMWSTMDKKKGNVLGPRLDQLPADAKKKW